MSRGSGTRELVDDIVELAEIPAPTFFEEARLAWLERRLDGLPAYAAATRSAT